MLSLFVLCLRNKWSIYWWANDGDWTRAWWIHNPLPWSTWLHPPLPPHRFKSLSTIRSLTPLWPLSKKSFFLYYSCKSIVVFWEAKLQKALRASWQSFKQRGWAVHFIDLTSLDLRLKIEAGRAVKARLVDSKLRLWRAATTPIKMKSSKRSLKKRAPIRESHCALASCLYRVPNLRTPKLQALKPLLFWFLWDIWRKKPLSTNLSIIVGKLFELSSHAWAHLSPLVRF